MLHAGNFLRDFWEHHPQAKGPLSVWYRVIEHDTFRDFNPIKRTFGSADYVAPYTTLDMGGNNFRIVTAIHQSRQRVYIRYVFTHSEYHAWSDEMRWQKRKNRG
jgi:mRNA interferase HigB